MGDVEEIEPRRDALHVVDDVVHLEGKVHYIVSVERRDEGRIELLHDGLDALVAFRLMELHLRNHDLRLGIAAYQLLVVDCALLDCSRKVLELRVERIFFLHAGHGPPFLSR